MGDITWRDVYDGPEELADCLSRGAAECERRGQYELSSHATVAAQVLYELSEENAKLRKQIALLRSVCDENERTARHALIDHEQIGPTPLLQCARIVVDRAQWMRDREASA